MQKCYLMSAMGFAICHYMQMNTISRSLMLISERLGTQKSRKLTVSTMVNKINSPTAAVKCVQHFNEAANIAQTLVEMILDGWRKTL